MQSDKTKTQHGITALYPRLSRDNDAKEESNSIANQKKLLAKFAKDNGFTNTKFYPDDGYTGTNFSRPNFQRMVEDIEAGYVTTVIVKDMSRLGRDYLERVMGIGPTRPAWKAGILPLNYTRVYS